ncbi:putative phosphatidate phosphatase isoform X2 [Plodia interpunctella]|uniref:putative phosphatidate phosphatase isoform X2 n=1 Tax=Plodia interpunctella TaxID=58824 RepID=UPI002368DB4F|nr:putative phosphatidate phosphatase isoform X2 [Plodia interpunctella]
MACDRIFCNVFLDVLVLACVCIPLLLLQIYAKPYRRGYFESDESIRYRYWEQSISETVLGIFGFIIVIIIVLVTEICQKNPGPGSGKKFLAGKPIAGWVWDSYRTIGVYSFGAACQQLTVTIGKYTLGRLRPHFYEVCQPVPADSALNHLGYIVNYNCAGTDEARIMNARLSFPSGHSCYAIATSNTDANGEGQSSYAILRNTWSSSRRGTSASRGSRSTTTTGATSLVASSLARLLPSLLSCTS